MLMVSSSAVPGQSCSRRKGSALINSHSSTNIHGPQRRNYQTTSRLDHRRTAASKQTKTNRRGKHSSKCHTRRHHASQAALDPICCVEPEKTKGYIQHSIFQRPCVRLVVRHQCFLRQQLLQHRSNHFRLSILPRQCAFRMIALARVSCGPVQTQHGTGKTFFVMPHCTACIQGTHQQRAPRLQRFRKVSLLTWAPWKASEAPLPSLQAE